MGVSEQMLEEVGQLLGSAVTLEGYLGHKGRAMVARLRRADGSTVVAKGQRWGSGGPDPWSPPNRFRNEVSTLGVLRGAQGVVPTLVAVDHERQWMVLEDMGDVTSLADALLGDDPAAAADALCGWAAALGRLHHYSADPAMLDEWESARRSLGGAVPYEAATEVLESARPVLEDFVVVTPDVGRAVAAVDRRLGAREWWALTPRDACPDNCARRADGSYMLFDFEGGGGRHALLDAAYLTSTFPTCWCTGPLPASARERALGAYRDAAGWPHDAGSFDAHLAAASAFHVLWDLWMRLPVALGEKGGETHLLPEVGFEFPSWRQIVTLALDDLGRALAGDNELAALAAFGSTLRGALAASCDGWELPPPHPAFAP